MSLFMEIETDRKLPFDARKIAELVIETSLDYVKCPYETEVSLLPNAKNLPVSHNLP